MSSSVASLTGADVPASLLIGGEWTGGRGGWLVSAARS